MPANLVTSVTERVQALGLPMLSAVLIYTVQCHLMEEG